MNAFIFYDLATGEIIGHVHSAKQPSPPSSDVGVLPGRAAPESHIVVDGEIVEREEGATP